MIDTSTLLGGIGLGMVIGWAAGGSGHLVLPTAALCLLAVVVPLTSVTAAMAAEVGLEAGFGLRLLFDVALEDET